MARGPRIWYPGATYHVTARGIRKSIIFESHDDHLTYLKILEKVRTRNPFILHSYCLMTNHIHLLIETKSDDIGKIMREIHSRYAMYFNRKYDYIGHVFQGRFNGKIIENVSYLLEASRYIHLNPVEAQMVLSAEDYLWSSYRAFISSYEDPHVDPTKLLSHFSDPKQQNYQKFVETKEDPTKIIAELLRKNSGV